jgi:hypothetical protein
MTAPVGRWVTWVRLLPLWLLFCAPTPASATAFGSWHTSLPKSSGPTLSSAPNISALVPLLRASNQTLHGVDAASCEQLARLPSVLAATAGSGIRIFAVVGSHSPLHTYCPVFQNSARTDLNWSAVGYELATAARGHAHFVGVYVDDFYAAVRHPAHETFGRGGVRTQTYSLASSADQLRAALKAVDPSLLFIPLVYTSQFGYGLPGAHVIGAPGGASFSGSDRVAVSFSAAAPTNRAAKVAGSPGPATLKLFFVNDLNAWYLNVSSLAGALALTVSVNGQELYRVDAASLSNAHRVRLTVPPHVLSSDDSGGRINITVATQPTSAKAGTPHFQSLDRLSYVWGVSLRSAAGAELVDGRRPVSYAIRGGGGAPGSAGRLLAAPTTEYSVIGHCDAIIAMTSQDPATYQDAETYEDLMSDAKAKASAAKVQVWAGHYSRRGLLWSHPVSSATLGAMISSDKKLQLEASLIWNFALELEWMGSQRGIFSAREPVMEEGPELINDAARDPPSEEKVKLIEFWPDNEIAYPNWFQSHTSTGNATGNVSLALSTGRGGHMVVSPPLDGCKLIKSQVRTCFLKRVLLGDTVATGVLLYEEEITSATIGLNLSCVVGTCPGLSQAAQDMGIRCHVGCLPSEPDMAQLLLQIPAVAAAPIVIELRAVGTFGNMGVGLAIAVPRSIGPWRFASGCDDPPLLHLHETARREFLGLGPSRDVILYQRTDNQNASGLAQIAAFAIKHNASFTHVAPTTYMVTPNGTLEAWSEHDEIFAAQFLSHGLHVLPLIWADCASHPRPIAAFRKIMSHPTDFVRDAISRAHQYGWSGYVLDWEPTGELTLEDSQAFPRFIDTFANAMHGAVPPLELHGYAGWEHQPAVKHGIPWRAHWFNYSLEGASLADFMEVGLTYDYTPKQASNITAWEQALLCVLGRIDRWPGNGASSYACDGHVRAPKLGAGLMSHIPTPAKPIVTNYTSAEFASRLDVVKKLALGGPLNIWVDQVPDLWLPLLAEYIRGG